MRKRDISQVYSKIFPKAYDSYEESVDFLQRPQVAIKHNYSDDDVKIIKFWVSKNGLVLNYRNKRLKQRGLLCKLTSYTKSINLDEICGFIYGAHSQTFVKKREIIMGMMNL